MNSTDYLLVVFLLAIVAISIVIYSIYDKAKKYVLENSVAIKQITLLSKKYYFHPINASHIYRKSQNSLAAFRRINYENELLNHVRSNQFFWEAQIKNLSENNRNYKNYINEFNYIRNIQKTNWNSKLKEHIEDKLLQKAKLNPTCDICIVIENVYASPKGRNRYFDSSTFNQIDIINSLKKIELQDRFEEQKQKERSKMSDSLRYDILKRDGFKCTICGASAQDGAKLHVDHIIPVSKGGKTTKNNLRTLCSSCNLGKSDKYDPHGIN